MIDNADTMSFRERLRKKAESEDGSSATESVYEDDVSSESDLQELLILRSKRICQAKFFMMALIFITIALNLGLLVIILKCETNGEK